MPDVLETLQKLPKVCAVTKERANTLAIEHPYLIHRGRTGYDPRPGWTDRHCESINEGVSRQQMEAMIHGSVFGWHTPAADPDNWDANGKCIFQSEAETVALDPD